MYFWYTWDLYNFYHIRMWHSWPWQCFCLDIYSSFWSLLSKGDCPALWPFLKQILGRSSSHVALIEMIGGGGVASTLCLTRVYLPGAKPGEGGRKNGEKGGKGEKKKREEEEKEGGKKKKSPALLDCGRAQGSRPSVPARAAGREPAGAAAAHPPTGDRDRRGARGPARQVGTSAPGGEERAEGEGWRETFSRLLELWGGWGGWGGEYGGGGCFVLSSQEPRGLLFYFLLRVI